MDAIRLFVNKSDSSSDSSGDSRSGDELLQAHFGASDNEEFGGKSGGVASKAKVIKSAVGKKSATKAKAGGAHPRIWGSPKGKKKKPIQRTSSLGSINAEFASMDCGVAPASPAGSADEPVSASKSVVSVAVAVVISSAVVVALFVAASFLVVSVFQSFVFSALLAVFS